MWRQIDLHKSKRRQKLIDRAHSKLQHATSRQVDQIVIFNQLLDTLSKHDMTMTRFQANSLTLHRCLIKWDKMKAHDRSFTRTSIRLALELQRFMSQMDEYFRIPEQVHHPHHPQVIVVEETTNITTTESNELDHPNPITGSAINLNEAFVEIIAATGPSNSRSDLDPQHHHPHNLSTTVSTNLQPVSLPTPSSTTTTIVQSINSITHPNHHHLHNNQIGDIDRDRDHNHDNNDDDIENDDEHERPPLNINKKSLGIRKQIMLKYKLSQLRFKTQKFNQKFEDHESKKIKLKLNGNQCIFNMVEDGKSLLELNEALVDLVFYLCLLRKNKNDTSNNNSNGSVSATNNNTTTTTTTTPSRSRSLKSKLPLCITP